MNRAQRRNCSFTHHAADSIGVLSSCQIAVESCLPRPLLRTLSFFVSVFFACSLADAQTPSPAISLDDAVRQLAERVAAIPNLRGPVHLGFFQEPGFEAETGKAWRDTFRNAIEERHVLLSNDASVTSLRIGVGRDAHTVHRFRSYARGRKRRNPIFVNTADFFPGRERSGGPDSN